MPKPKELKEEYPILIRIEKAQYRWLKKNSDGNIARFIRSVLRKLMESYK